MADGRRRKKCLSRAGCSETDRARNASKCVGEWLEKRRRVGRCDKQKTPLVWEEPGLMTRGTKPGRETTRPDSDLDAGSSELPGRDRTALRWWQRPPSQPPCTMPGLLFLNLFRLATGAATRVPRDAGSPGVWTPRRDSRSKAENPSAKKLGLDLSDQLTGWPMRCDAGWPRRWGKKSGRSPERQSESHRHMTNTIRSWAVPQPYIIFRQPPPARGGPAVAKSR